MASDIAALRSSRRLLARVLDTPDLADQVRALPPTALAKLVDHVGLEDAGEIVALATTEQLERIFDEDLWKNDRPGDEERFDDERFVVWLEALLEAGDALVATRLSELPEDLVTLAFHKRVLVVPLDTLMTELRDAEDADAAEKALSNCLSEELDEYLIIARRPDGWDAVLSALLALDRDHHDAVVRILERCASMSTRDIEERGGLYDVLTSEEMLESDVGAEREGRRAEAGYVAPQAAAAFLKLASATAETAATEHDPLTRAYFRDLERKASSTARPPPRAAAVESDLSRLLVDAGVVDTRDAPRLPAATDAPAGATEARFTRAMRELKRENPDVFAKRSEELAYLANVLVAGCTIDGRRVRPIEGVTAAIAICEAGLDLALGPTEQETSDVGSFRRATEVLATHPADGLFRLGWKTMGLQTALPARLLGRL